jgi:hypothetical protein
VGTSRTSRDIPAAAASRAWLATSRTSRGAAGVVRSYPAVAGAGVARLRTIVMSVAAQKQAMPEATKAGR